MGFVIFFVSNLAFTLQAKTLFHIIAVENCAPCSTSNNMNGKYRLNRIDNKIILDEKQKLNNKEN